MTANTRRPQLFKGRHIKIKGILVVAPLREVVGLEVGPLSKIQYFFPQNQNESSCDLYCSKKRGIPRWSSPDLKKNIYGGGGGGLGCFDKRGCIKKHERQRKISFDQRLTRRHWEHLLLPLPPPWGEGQIKTNSGRWGQLEFSPNIFSKVKRKRRKSCTVTSQRYTFL